VVSEDYKAELPRPRFFYGANLVEVVVVVAVAGCPKATKQSCPGHDSTGPTLWSWSWLWLARMLPPLPP
jgi:hypothetical protein